mmetsp:Transcript_7928/g.17393  ORF Transcript_7928/g.17393 Transcript_7928/m.17393 type:complete len:337 (-) Transcript_7928:83-1093(-)|eukprot:CAMPEP_0183346702 /NCGR_PEP_ID=MMETSP0164_2-20130417/11737_1 /TAXON_ID=221442 /ORGANISM="Coccolithus pelagicus ssp braarudi, Strain PLY182g" /LENGTH=336 /DNA_ID=CAMNT_0025518017 /DNA_START=99 /DNA_END=1109 /DNA_ORIENTATION=-
MAFSVAGLAFSLVAIFSWGTALIPLKLASGKKNGVTLMTLGLSSGYLLSAGVAALVLHSVEELEWVSSGLIGGVLWGLGKILVTRAVAGAGLAAAQAIQCVFNIGAAFVAGVALFDEPASATSAVAVFLLMVGLVTIAVPCPPRCSALFASQLEPPEGLLGQTERETNKEHSEANSHLPHIAALGLAAVSGVLIGCQSVPFKLDKSEPSSWAYTISQSISQFTVIVIACGTLFVIERRRVLALQPVEEPRPPLIPRPDGILLALGGGVLLFVAAACSTTAVSLMGLSVAQPVAQLNMVVAGAWGIYGFHEVTNPLEIVRFFTGCVVAVAGAVVLQV